MRRKIIRCERVVAQVQVVVESDFDRRADTELRPGEEGFDGLRHQVGGAVPVRALPLVIFPGQDPDRGIGLNGARKVPCVAVHGDRQRFARQAAADALGHLQTGDTTLMSAGRTVGQCDRDLFHRDESVRLILKKLSLTSRTLGTISGEWLWAIQESNL